MSSSQGLNVDQRDEYQNHKNIASMYDDYQSDYDKRQPLKDEVASYKDNIQALEKEVPAKIQSSVPDTAKKNALKLQIANEYDTICSDTLAYATKIKNTDLAATVNYTAGKLLYIADDNFAPTIATINQAIAPLLNDKVFQTYQITQTDLDNGEKNIATFISYLPLPSTTSSQIAAAEAEIEKLFLPLRANKLQFSKLMRRYAPTGKEPKTKFFAAWEAVKDIVHTGGKITMLDGVIIDATTKKPIPNALVKNLQTGKFVHADLLGHYHLEKFNGGLFEFEYSAPGYKPQKVVIKIVKGKHFTQDIELEPIV